MTDFAPVDIEGSDKLDVTATIPADRMAHDAFERGALTIPVILYALHQRTGAIADPGNGDFDTLMHGYPSPRIKRLLALSVRL